MGGVLLVSVCVISPVGWWHDLRAIHHAIKYRKVAQPLKPSYACACGRRCGSSSSKKKATKAKPQASRDDYRPRQARCAG